MAPYQSRALPRHYYYQRASVHNVTYALASYHILHQLSHKDKQHESDRCIQSDRISYSGTWVPSTCLGSNPLPASLSNDTSKLPCPYTSYHNARSSGQWHSSTESSCPVLTPFSFAAAQLYCFNRLGSALDCVCLGSSALPMVPIHQYGIGRCRLLGFAKY